MARHVTVPLSRYGLIGSWLLMFLIAGRSIPAGVYLLSPGTETIGSMLVSLWAAGAIDIVAATLLYQYSASGDWPWYRPAL